MPRTTASDDRPLSLVALFPAERHVSLLGGFRILQGGQPFPVPTDVQRFVAFLALNEGPASRDRVASVLWPDSSESRAGSSLRSALWRLRRLAPWVIEPEGSLQISDAVEIDVRAARTAADALASSPASSTAEPDIAPFALDLLPDWYDDWVLIERERWRQVRLHALEDLCELLTARGRHGKAVDAGLAAVAGEPLRETAHRVLIQAHLAEGNVNEAVREYRSYRNLLQEELGVEPSEELERLIGVLPS